MRYFLKLFLNQFNYLGFGLMYLMAPSQDNQDVVLSLWLLFVLSLAKLVLNLVNRTGGSLYTVFSEFVTWSFIFIAIYKEDFLWFGIGLTLVNLLGFVAAQFSFKRNKLAINQLAVEYTSGPVNDLEVLKLRHSHFQHNQLLLTILYLIATILNQYSSNYFFIMVTFIIPILRLRLMVAYYDKYFDYVNSNKQQI